MKHIGFFILFAGTIITSCTSNNNVTPNTVEVDISFTHSVDGNPVQLDQLIYKNILDQEFSIKTIKYFISGVKLYAEDNSIIELDDIHYIDARTAETLNHIFSQKIPPGNYKGISFIHGLTVEENITGRFPESPESLMEWPVMMGGGYHYMKLEGEYKTPSEESFFNFHSGMLDGNPYEVHVDLTNQPFTTTGTSVHLNLNMEIQNWFTNPTDWDFVFFGPAIMSNAAAQKIVQDNGADVYSFAVLENI